MPRKKTTGDFNSTAGYQLDVREPRHAVEFKQRVLRFGDDRLALWRQEAKMNLAWASGDHSGGNAHSAEDDPSLDEEKGTDPFWVNRLRRYVEHAISRIYDGQLTWRVTPLYADPNDIILARVLDRILPHWWTQLGMDHPDGFYLALWHILCTGIVFANPTWQHVEDEDEVVSRADVAEGVNKFRAVTEKQAEIDREPVKPMSQEDLVEGWLRLDRPNIDVSRVSLTPDGGLLIRKGRMRLDWLGGLNVIEDLSVGPWEDKEWVDVWRRVPVASLLERYPKKADRIIASVRRLDDHSRERGDAGNDDASRDISESVELHTIWHKVSKKYPKGWFNHIVGDEWLDGGPNPYHHGRIPVIRIAERPDPDNVRPRPLFSDLRIIQNGLNGIDLDVMNHLRRTSKPGWLAERGTINEADLGSNRFAIDTYERGAKAPIPKILPPLSQEHQIQRQVLKEDLEDLAGMNAPSTGRPSSQSPTASGTIALIRRSDLQLRNIQRVVMDGVGLIARDVLSFQAQFVPNKTTLLIGGKHGERELVILTGSELVQGKSEAELNQALRFDVKVELAPKPSMEEVTDRIDFLLQRGILIPEIHSSVILEAVNNRDLAVLDIDRDEREAAVAENEAVKKIVDEIDEGLHGDREKPNQKSITDTFNVHVRFRVTQDHGTHFLVQNSFMNRMGNRLPLILLQLAEGHIVKHKDEMERIMQQRAMAGKVGEVRGTGQGNSVVTQAKKAAEPTIGG